MYFENQGMNWGEEMLKSYKFRLYPNQEQRIYLAKTLGFPKFKKKSNTNSYTTNNQKWYCAY